MRNAVDGSPTRFRPSFALVFHYVLCTCVCLCAILSSKIHIVCNKKQNEKLYCICFARIVVC